MTPDEFKAWRKAMGYTQKSAAEALDVSVDGVKTWETRPAGGKIPRTVALACTALYHRMAPWPGSDAPDPSR